MMRCKGFVIFLVGVTLCAGCKATPHGTLRREQGVRPSQKAPITGARLGKRKRWERSQETLTKAYAHYALGTLHDNEHRFQEAVREFERALAYDDQSSAIHTRLGASYIKLHKFDKAIEELKIAQKLDPADQRPRALLALLYISLRRFPEAIQEYEGALEYNPNETKLLFSLADLYVIQGDLEKAAGTYQTLITKEENGLLHFNLGIIYTRLLNWEKRRSILSVPPNWNLSLWMRILLLGFSMNSKRKTTKPLRNMKKPCWSIP